jgi:hypothetical protein
MAVVTSDFHMPRSQEIFEWVFGLQGTGNSIGKQNNIEGQLVFPLGSRSQGFLLEYHGVSDQGIDKSIIQVSLLTLSLCSHYFLFMQCKEHILATIYPVTLETLDV